MRLDVMVRLVWKDTTPSRIKAQGNTAEPSVKLSTSLRGRGVAWPARHFGSMTNGLRATETCGKIQQVDPNTPRV